MTRPVGRPPVPDGKRRVQVGGKVAPETVSRLSAEQVRTGEPWGRVVDRAALALAAYPYMIRALADIDAALGLPEDGCNSTARTIAAIRALREGEK